MLGIASTFLTAILTGRAISINWEHEIPFDILFDSPYIDWSTKFRKANSTSPRAIYNSPAAIEDHITIPCHDVDVDLDVLIENEVMPRNETWLTVGLHSRD